MGKEGREREMVKEVEILRNRKREIERNRGKDRGIPRKIYIE